MQPSFVSRPTGKEQGRFVTLDLGGTNVRATVVDLRGDGGIHLMKSDSFRLPMTSGSGSDLFDPIADFLGSLLETDAHYNLGFIFAFPIDQTGIRSGRLTKWTKEFAFDGVEGRDVVSLLQAAVDRRSTQSPALRRVRVSALANDTVGVLAAGAYLDTRCDVGLIVGTGYNLAVAVPLDSIEHDRQPPAGNPNEMLINMECGNFDGVRTIQTEVDRLVDAGSGTEGQLIEKMISGRYLGEIVRLQVAETSSLENTFSGWLSHATTLDTPYAFSTEDLSDILFDSSPHLAATGMVLARLGVADASAQDRQRLFEICASVADRSAFLVALSIVATASYIDPDLERDHVVAVDGSVFRGIPDYQNRVEAAIADILQDRPNPISLAYVRDGSGLGAAVIAAVAAG